MLNFLWGSMSSFYRAKTRSAFRFFPTRLAHGVATQFDAMGVVDTGSPPWIRTTVHGPIAVVDSITGA
jgi:hypothetical protein